VRRVVLALAGVLGVAGAPVTPPAIAGPADGTLTVRLVRDVNGNGSYEPALEVGVAGIPVTVTDPGGATAKGSTGADGVVKIDLGPVSGGGYRVEAVIPDSMPWLEPAPGGNGLSALTDFVTGPNPSITMGVWNPADYCQTNPTLAVACQRNSEKAGAQPDARSVVTVPFTARGTQAATPVAGQGQTGSVSGLAYRKQDKRLFSAAFAKRLAPYGPGGSGAVYVTKSGTTTQFATVPGAGGTQHTPDSHEDAPFAAAAGRESLGDIEVSEDGTALYVVNLADRTLYVYDATVATASAPVASYAIPGPCGNDWRPAALGGRDGMLYVGGVCSGAELKAVVLPFKNGAFGPAVLTRPLDGHWHAWRDSAKETSYPQPLLTDIGVENDGDLLLAFRDRYGDQTADAVTAGDLVRACEQADGTFGWECPANAEVAMGGLALVPGADRMPVTVLNPLADRTSGIGWLDRTTGAMQKNALQVMSEGQEGWANGLGDLEALCDLAPLQLGNRVWFDEDTDGVQEGTEPGLAGVRITATPCAGGAALPVKVSGPKGEYAFSSADGLKPDTCYNLKFDYSAANTSAIPGAPPGSTLKWTVKGAGPNRHADSNVDPGTGLATVTLGAAGSVDNDIDAGLVAPTSTLGDYVWADTDRDGQQDPGEPGVPGVTVLLGNRKTSTGADGRYTFGKLPDGIYQVCFDLKNLPPAVAGYLPAAANTGSDTGDSDADPKTGCTQQLTMGGAKHEDLTLDLGLRPPNSLGDLVWSDTNRNGRQDADEPGVPGVTVTVGELTAVTGLDGKYLFDKLPDGRYPVCFDLTSLPASYLDFQATKQDSGEDGTDSDIDPDTGCAPPVTLSAATAENLNVDAGLVPPVNRIGDFVWGDANRNGLQDPGERGIEGVPVTVGNLKTVTARDGKYLFEGMPDGKYSVCFGKFSDFVFTTPKTGEDTKDSDADPVSGCAPEVGLGPGDRSVRSIDAGLLAPPDKLGDLVWNDTNRNGLQDAGEPGVAGVVVTAGNLRTVTGADGKYLFESVPDGKYTVCFELKKAGDFQITKPNAGDDGLDSDADPGTGCAPEVVLGPGSRSVLSVDAGIAAPVNRLGDSVFNDANRNGVQDPGEPGVPGVAVFTGTLKTGALKTVTAADGKYLFEGMPDGSYQVCVDLKSLPAGYSVVKSLDATGCTPAVTVGPGSREVLTVDIGLAAPPNSLGDFVWNDTNRNGLQDSGEPGVAGVVVTAGDRKSTTGSDGRYSFADLGDGKYTVCFARKDDLQFVRPNAGEDSRDSDADPASGCAPEVMLSGGTAMFSVDAGVTAPVNRLGGLVSLSKAGIGGVSVTAGPAKTVTGPDGRFLIEGLPDGTYQVCFTPPLDYQVAGCSPDIALGPGHRENLAVDITLAAPPNKLGDLVWLDSNRNGRQDTGEPGVPDVTVTAGPARTTTGPDGKYLFDGLPDGDYRVCFDLRIPQYPGYLPTLQGKASGAADDGCADTITLGPGKRTNLGVDLGIRPPNSLGDHVWADTDRNGRLDDGEPGVGGVKVSLSTGQTTKTDDDGDYLFANLPDGQYVVCFDRATLPAQYASFQLTTGVVDQATWCTRPTRLFAGKYEDLTQDAGIAEPRNRVGDLVWLDSNRNGGQDTDESGAPNVLVLLRGPSGQELTRTTTDRNGKYLFDELADGTYLVCVVPTELKGYSVGSGADARNGCSKPVTVGPSARELLTTDIGLLPPKALAKTGASLGWLVTGGVLVLVLGLLLLLHRRRSAEGASH
jgi:hypothetical protein